MVIVVFISPPTVLPLILSSSSCIQSPNVRLCTTSNLLNRSFIYSAALYLLHTVVKHLFSLIETFSVVSIAQAKAQPQRSKQAMPSSWINANWDSRQKG
ncbi:hypothetical protein CNC00135 [Cryptococcus deneoformans JEC21]|uniref:Uncharacterized protein n=1 Tax=Cryptococcus deneoformans (strain JEC21 / ATCC MYA-565) TaxID=214684 RepID=A0A0S2LIA3_CRYD1|nr:hypothetical protein CNC00135 [Cryptococcus neoformans var. neoformans JEC21]ALO60435.1 hypothetical protein CNC00135 [Cryptococcus neoformans var. neoformans JEC21]